MPKVRVVRSHCLGGGIDVWEGQVIELSDADALQKSKAGWVEIIPAPIPEPTAPDPPAPPPTRVAPPDPPLPAPIEIVPPASPDPPVPAPSEPAAPEAAASQPPAPTPTRSGRGGNR